MKYLITGSEGFVAKHLMDYLWENDPRAHIIGFDQRNGQDVRDYEQLRTIVDQFSPDRIFHLAAQAHVPESFISPNRSLDINLYGSLNLFEAVRQTSIDTRILVAGTSEEYGDTSDENEPITEETPLNPMSPYSVGKAGMDYMAQIYNRAYGMNIIITRAFNHTGPGRHERYAETSFAKQIALIEKGHQAELSHGNLESVRNYTDVRDVVKAYTLAIEQTPSVYNICSDNNVTMQQIMDILVANATCKIPLQINPKFYRKSDFSFKKPSCQKLQGLTGWKAEITLEQMIKDVLEDWRARV